MVVLRGRSYALVYVPSRPSPSTPSRPLDQDLRAAYDGAAVQDRLVRVSVRHTDVPPVFAAMMSSRVDFAPGQTPIAAMFGTDAHLVLTVASDYSNRVCCTSFIAWLNG